MIALVVWLVGFFCLFVFFLLFVAHIFLFLCCIPLKKEHKKRFTAITMDDARTFLDIFFVVVLRRRVGQEDKLQEQKPSREDAKSGGKERERERERERKSEKRHFGS